MCFCFSMIGLKHEIKAFHWPRINPNHFFHDVPLFSKSVSKNLDPRPPPWPHSGVLKCVKENSFWPIISHKSKMLPSDWSVEVGEEEGGFFCLNIEKKMSILYPSQKDEKNQHVLVWVSIYGIIYSKINSSKIYAILICSILFLFCYNIFICPKKILPLSCKCTTIGHYLSKMTHFSVSNHYA